MREHLIGVFLTSPSLLTFKKSIFLNIIYIYQLFLVQPSYLFLSFYLFSFFYHPLLILCYITLLFLFIPTSHNLLLRINHSFFYVSTYLTHHYTNIPSPYVKRPCINLFLPFPPGQYSMEKQFVRLKINISCFI